MNKYIVYYLKYKRLILPSFFGGLAVFIVFFVIIPQVNSISTLSAEVSEASNKVQILKRSSDVISAQNDAELDSKLSAATEALPTAKDIARIFGALNSAAAASNTSLREFSLSVGGVYGKAAELPDGAPSAPSMQVVARVEGDTRATASFAQALARKFPLSEISKIDGSGSTSSFEINFYFKPVNASILSKQDRVEALSAEDSEFLNSLSAGNNE